MIEKPVIKPDCPNFSSGPCAKRPNWKAENLFTADLGRSHRSVLGHERLKRAIDLMRDVLQVPDDYRIGILPASDTGAIECALWSMIGARGVDMFGWETFGKSWINDVKNQLKIKDLRTFEAPYGQLPDLSAADFDRDVVFAWNGTTSGVRVPDGDWIKADRKGLTICDATSAVFAMEMPWDKLDVTTFSWQKALGGEGAHGVMIISPRAVERLESYEPAWPMPKIFRLTNKGKLIDGIWVGDTINTPSMLCVEDIIDALEWAQSIGGKDELIKRSMRSLGVLEAFAAKSDWLDFLAADKSIRSNTSVCFIIKDPWFTAKSDEDRRATAKKIVKLLGDEGAAFDCGSYRDAPAGLRIWCGSTVETSDVEKLCPWLDWAYKTVKAQG